MLFPEAPTACGRGVRKVCLVVTAVKIDGKMEKKYLLSTERLSHHE
jgi:hypothetical protein